MSILRQKFQNSGMAERYAALKDRAAAKAESAIASSRRYLGLREYEQLRSTPNYSVRYIKGVAQIKLHHEGVKFKNLRTPATFVGNHAPVLISPKAPVAIQCRGGNLAIEGPGIANVTLSSARLNSLSVAGNATVNLKSRGVSTVDKYNIQGSVIRGSEAVPVMARGTYGAYARSGGYQVDATLAGIKKDMLDNGLPAPTLLNDHLNLDPEARGGMLNLRASRFLKNLNPHRSLEYLQQKLFPLPEPAPV